jgi:hypothetical protein
MCIYTIKLKNYNFYFCCKDDLMLHCVNGPAMIYNNFNNKYWYLNYKLIVCIDKNE